MATSCEWHQVLKCIVLGFTIVPIRGLLVFLLIVFATCLSIIGTAGMQPNDYDQPLPRWRVLVLAPLRPTLRAILFVAGVWITVHGAAAPKSEAPIVVSNHRGFLEPMFFISELGGNAVAASQHSRQPLVGAVLIALQSILVHIDKRESMDKYLPTSVSDAVSKITARARDQRFGRVLIFPEGTCGNGDVVLSFKTGAFKPGLPVQPVTVEFPFRYCDVSWCSDEPSLEDLVCRILCQVYTPMVVTYLPVITPTPEERADATLYARHVQEVIAQSLGVLPTSHSYDDYLLSHFARVAHYPPEIGVIEIQKLRGLLDVDIKTAQQYLQLFMLADAEKTGRISADQFAEIFLPAATAAVESEPEEDVKDVNPHRALHRLFALLDTDGNGWLNYRDFLVGLCVVNERSRAGGRSDALRMAFKIIDSGGRGAISREEFRRILLRAWPEMDASVADAAFSSADVDHDGLLTMSEFVAWGDAEESGGMAAAFRRAFMGFAQEPDLLQLSGTVTHRNETEITVVLTDWASCDLFLDSGTTQARKKGASRN